MRADYAQQLSSIEDAFERERAEILKHNDHMINNLFTEHKNVEEAFLTQRAAEEDNYAKELEELRSTDANKQADHKIKLEKELQILEKCMEDMKAVYKLNEEKLGYNEKVLKDRHKLNQKQIAANKKKKKKLADQERAVKAEFQQKEENYKRDNYKLANDYKKFTKQFKELQKKFERFEKSDDNRIKEIKSMNEEEARSIVKKIVDADRVIHI